MVFILEHQNKPLPLKITSNFYSLVQKLDIKSWDRHTNPIKWKYNEICKSVKTHKNNVKIIFYLYMKVARGQNSCNSKDQNINSNILEYEINFLQKILSKFRSRLFL